MANVGKKPRPQQVHYGLVTVSDGKCRPQTLQLKLTPDVLILQREEFIFPDDDDGYPIDNKLRSVKLRRQPDGSLGISIKGGSDHNLPILISKVCRNEDDDHLYIGDAIVKVNNVSLTSTSHDEAIVILHNCGDELTLTVKHYKSAAPFLLKNCRQFIPETDGNASTDDNNGPSVAKQMGDFTDGNENSSQNVCSGILASAITMRRPTAPVIDSPSSVTSESNWNGVIPRVRRKWVDIIEVPLMMAYITRYIFGTDKLRPNAFEVRGMNGANTGVIHSNDLAVLSNWIKVISDNINILTTKKALVLNRLSGNPLDQISYMNWVAEGVLNRNQPWQNWKPKFMVLKGSCVSILDTPPLEKNDWLDSNTTTYKVYESMFRVIKESENVDERQHCFLIQTVKGESRYFSMETRQDLLRVESAWHRAVCQTISQMGQTTFQVVYKNVPAALTLDWTDGFLLKPFASPTYVFAYSFSQLKGSSDDGNATLRLQFRPSLNCHPDEVAEHEVICPKLQELLFYMHSFLTAKVASVDPAFLGNSTPTYSRSS